MIFFLHEEYSQQQQQTNEKKKKRNMHFMASTSPEEIELTVYHCQSHVSSSSYM